MDKIIKRFDSTVDADLALCEHRGVAYQRNMSLGRVQYDQNYQEKVKAYEGSPIAKKVNEGRVSMLARHLPDWEEDRRKRKAKVLDWGAGSGEFMRAAIASGYEMKGYDLNPVVQVALEQRGQAAGDPYPFDAITMWDTIEHMDQPGSVLQCIKKGSHFFVSVPIFEDLKKIRESKHYRPGEHLYYWTAEGFIGWMAIWGFRLLESSNHEIEAGRESIGAFAFCRDLPDYHDHISAYKVIHSNKHYGDSATDEYLDIAARVVAELKPKMILDYGCGRSDLSSHFWLDGARIIKRYDPAIGKYKVMPAGKFDIVFCLDVMEHIPMAFVEQVLYEIKTKGSIVLFSISTIQARAKLPDGRNAHVTLLTKDEWLRWVKDVFHNIRILQGKHAHELVILAGVS